MNTIDEIIESKDLKNIIMSIAKKFYGVETSDLYQVGYIGVLKAYKNYLKIYKQIENAKILLTQKFNKEPSLEEISAYLEIDLSLINDVIITTSSIISLDEESDVLNDSNLYTIVGTNYDYDTNILVRDSLEKLSDNERKVILYRYYEDYTQQEIANLLGINQVKVSRLETSSKKKIKEYICA